MSFEEQVKLQRPFRIRRSLRELVHKPSLSRSNRYSLKLPPLPSHDTNTEEYAYDILYECQRGSLSVGYSSKTLLQFDPNPWCDANMRFTPMNIENYQLPDPTWQWVSKNWMIDMTDDVDESGWQYALKFHGADWHGNYKHFRSFVRRRRWIRLRYRNKRNVETSTENEVMTKTLVDVEDVSSSQPSSSSFNHQEFTEQLQRCRLDREKMFILNNAIQSGHEDYITEKISAYLNMLDFEDTKYSLLTLLFSKKSFNQLTTEGKKAIQSLSYYSDVESLLEHVHVQ
ncbi:hypothetical protein G6F57_008279 [Rhizopus arrhizus]|uniref:Peroxin/Ferlin domain-containing protein n=1 Tax=Rhizopus oryzae TaxID=64495 RepID=A0A9P7BVC3_RHIOR|nr:hypothetical protein G6F23_006258 [Rhizopus arrhizus]KAG1411739.1 hypothetical protein G6F58_008400 [Rhizopus delemar]KAG0767597.1 hypothetical protein G6F24_002648 [Rhizopus arrhizus]KAG0786062.1 hypothetical protein G6F21_008854 [Rhizopus arrhizus]KAG0798880.1 hypothetical protein G6F22_003784 [Rhizopus arrhizus]